ncbi:hypothetical protein [Porticoccus sp.]
MKQHLAFRVAFFAAVCFAVPVTVALFVLVILNFQHDVSPAIANILLPLLATLATVFAAFAAYQSARAAKAFRRLTTRIALSEKTGKLIECLDELSAFLLSSGPRFILDSKPMPDEIRQFGQVYGKLDEARKATIQLGVVGGEIEQMLVISSVLMGYLGAHSLTEERARNLLHKIRPEFDYKTPADVFDVMSDELSALSSRLRADISLLD